MVKLLFKKLSDKAIIPTLAHETDAGWDLYSTEDTIIYPATTKKIKTGIAIQPVFKDPKDYDKFKLKIQLEGKSGLAGNKSLFPIGGVMDQGYTGEYIVILASLSDGPIEIKEGDKIAQFVPEIIPKITSSVVVEDFAEKTERGDNGFGSTGAR